MSKRLPPKSADDGDSFYKTQLEISLRENAQLQERLRSLEHDRDLLKKAVFELSMKPQIDPSGVENPIDVLKILRSLPASERYTTPVGKGSAYRRMAPDERAASSTRGLRDGKASQGCSADSGPFVCKASLEGHTGAVYAVQFSPNGHLLASASYDRSVCIWAMDKHLDKSNYEPHITLPDAHRSQVVAVEWTSDSRHVVTGGFDQYASEWDIPSETGQPTSRFPCCGMVQAVTVCPSNNALFFAPTLQKVVHLFDRRVAPKGGHCEKDPTIIIHNDEVINTLHVQLDGKRFVTGDRGGAIKTWDLRKMSTTVDSGGRSSGSKRYTAALYHTAYNGLNRSPITHVHNSPPIPGSNHGRFMAVNSYDDHLRVYDRGSFIFQRANVEFKLLHELQGPNNMHLPIKSSFFMGADYKPERSLVRGRGRRTRASSTRSSELGGKKKVRSEELDEELSTSSDSSSEDDELNGHDHDERQSSRIQSTLTLATGSADGCVYVFDVGGRPGTGSLMQRLEQHQDRVYSVDFHPSEPILASCSADSQIKIWATVPHNIADAGYQ